MKLRIKESICLFLILSLFAIFSGTAFSGQISAQTLYTLIKNNEANVSRLNSKVNNMQDNYVALYRRIDKLQKELAAEKQRNIRLENSIAAIKGQINNDRQLMQKNLDNVINKVSQETSRAINQAAKQQVQPRTSQRKQNDGEYEVYTVQPGATLSAIAKAYSVSVESIRKANQIDGDMIRVGEKLYIPQN